MNKIKIVINNKHSPLQGEFILNELIEHYTVSCRLDKESNKSLYDWIQYTFGFKKEDIQTAPERDQERKFNPNSIHIGLNPMYGATNFNDLFFNVYLSNRQVALKEKNVSTRAERENVGYFEIVEE